METSQIINIVLVVLCAAAYGVQLYFKTRGSVFESASQLISEIESSGLLGAEKMAFVVSKLFAMIPAPLKTVFTESRLRELAQQVFDNMKKYALERAKAIDDKNKTEAIKPDADPETSSDEEVVESTE